MQWTWVSTDRHYSYVKDHLGNIRMIIDDETGDITCNDFSPYGEILRSYVIGSNNSRYQFTGKERDKETGLDYFGARYYDSFIGRFLSADRFADKYPTFTPYHYAANNPLRFIDINGDSLDLAGNQQTALQYLQSLVDSRYAGLITIDQNGRVAFNTQGIDLSSDAALTLLSNLINGSDKYLFEVLSKGQTGNGISRISGQLKPVDPDMQGGVLNYSVTSKHPQYPSGLLPASGYVGSVSLGSGSWTFLNGTPQPVSNVVFHELAECYYRTHDQLPYGTGRDPKSGHDTGGAHERAMIDASKFSKQVGPAGEGIYVP